jgi:hypothetical protein
MMAMFRSPRIEYRRNGCPDLSQQTSPMRVGEFHVVAPADQWLTHPLAMTDMLDNPVHSDITLAAYCSSSMLSRCPDRLFAALASLPGTLSGLIQRSCAR